MSCSTSCCLDPAPVPAGASCDLDSRSKAESANLRAAKSNGACLSRPPNTDSVSCPNIATAIVQASISAVAANTLSTKGLGLARAGSKDAEGAKTVDWVMTASLGQSPHAAPTCIGLQHPIPPPSLLFSCDSPRRPRRPCYFSLSLNIEQFLPSLPGYSTVSTCAGRLPNIQLLGT